MNGQNKKNKKLMKKGVQRKWEKKIAGQIFLNCIKKYKLTRIQETRKM